MKPNFIGLLTLVAMPMAHAGVDTCDMQKPCVDWTMSKLDSSTCGLGGDCTVEVCMIVDESLDGCSKSDTFSHMCDQTGSDGCALWSDASGLDPVMSGSGSTGSCTSDTGEGVTGQVSGKCEGFSYIKMCQEGVAGQTLYWILKDGSDTTIETQKEYSFTYDAECNADVSCVNNLKRCAGGPNQQLMERTWMFKIPDTTGSCDICGSVDAPVDPPGGSVGDTPLDDVPASSPTSSHGDPHFRTWKNEHFEYHGQCDLVLAKDPEFADGLGLDVGIRTKLVRFWSYIKQAAVRIGDDILEIEGSADPTDIHYWINLEYKGELKTLGGFPVTTFVKESSPDQRFFEIDLSSKYPGVKIVLGTYKEFASVDFVNSSEEAFGKTVGLFGDFKTGKTFARDGFTVLDDFTELGHEWQVLPAEFMIFHDISEPQFPQMCIDPEDPSGERRRRLDESFVTEEQAEAACARIPDAADRKDCVYDILATQDIDMVGAY